LLAKSPLFAELVIHPLALAFAEAELGQSCQLSALLAINLQPGETVQPWHFDDSGAKIPRPRPALGVSTFWAIDDTTELNGATEIIPGSHLWEERNVEGAVKPADFTNRAENMCLAVPAAVAEKLPERARELIGYSIHPPFMRHVNGLHPRRLLHAHAT
jgi:ectoine hydroxylase-related dioxygenase (phytanoyl-CoA dioxygenase family)